MSDQCGLLFLYEKRAHYYVPRVSWQICQDVELKIKVSNISRMCIERDHGPEATNRNFLVTSSLHRVNPFGRLRAYWI